MAYIPEPLTSLILPQGQIYYSITIYIINLKEEVQLIHFRAIGKENETVHKLVKANEATVISVK